MALTAPRRLISRLFSRRPGTHLPRQSVPEHLRVFAIGDVHGHADLLHKMAGMILDDAKGSTKEVVTILLGDCIDRGPHSREVIEMLVGDVLPGLVAISGNHEDLLLSFLDGRSDGQMWLQNGGTQTLASYDVDIEGIGIGREMAGVAAEFRRKLPEAHQEFIRQMTFCHSLGDYFFCHAGIRPGVPLDAQCPGDLIWIREEFLLSRVDHGKIVVHGHTPVPEPEVLDNRINLDTGAFFTGKLTCLVLDGHTRTLMTT